MRVRVARRALLLPTGEAASGPIDERAVADEFLKSGVVARVADLVAAREGGTGSGVVVADGKGSGAPATAAPPKPGTPSCWDLTLHFEPKYRIP